MGGDYVWRPGPEVAERANVTRLMRAAGVGTIAELRRWSVEDVGRFWDLVVRDLAIPFSTPYEAVLDDSRGIEWTTWFTGGRVNLTSACVHRWAADPDARDRPAVIAEAEDGAVTTLTFAELAHQVDALASVLLEEGIGPGDAVGAFMPMVPEAVVAPYAIALIGAVYVPIFSGFAAGAIASRIRDSGARMVLTASAGTRRGRAVPMLPVLEEALATCPDVRRVLVLQRPEIGPPAPLRAGRDLDWSSKTATYSVVSKRLLTMDTVSEQPFMLAYTSGTTGRPKGAVHVHGGFLVKIAAEAAYQTDLRAGDRLLWVTDMGWIMGPWSMVGAHSLGAAMVMLEGSPDFPTPARIWAAVEKLEATVLGVSPTLIRALRGKGDEHHRAHDLSSLRAVGSTGEPWNAEPYEWLARDVLGGRLPIINISGGTEVGACFLSPHPVEEIRTSSLGGPSLGMDVAVYDPAGNELHGEVGELVCRKPWPGMTRGVWGDPERYIASYWSTYPGVWRHGDWARVDPDGQWFLFGRSDEAINVAGKRVGPAELESVLVAHPAVVEAAAVGVPDDLTGEAVWCFWTPLDPDGPDVSEELRDRVAAELGRPFRPARVVRVVALPRTRSAKILRRAVRAAAIGQDPGDLSTAENPEAVDAIRASLDAGN